LVHETSVSHIAPGATFVGYRTLAKLFGDRIFLWGSGSRYLILQQCMALICPANAPQKRSQVFKAPIWMPTRRRRIII